MYETKLEKCETETLRICEQEVLKVALLGFVIIRNGCYKSRDI